MKNVQRLSRRPSFRNSIIAAEACETRIMLAGVQFANINVVQNDTGISSSSVAVSLEGASEEFQIRAGSNRGDYFLQIGANHTDDFANGIMLTSIRQNGVDHGQGEGTQFGTSSIHDNGGGYIASLFEAPSGAEFNSDVAAAWFPYAEGWIGGLASNSTDGGPLTTLTGSPGLILNPSAGQSGITDNADGTYTVTLDGIDSQADGILLVNGGKGEDNFALAKAESDKTWTIFSHDNGVSGSTTEMDPVAFVFIPNNSPNVVSGKVAGNGTPLLASGSFTAADTGTGTIQLSISGVTPNDGVLIISPEGEETINEDNIISYEASGNGWEIQTRDLTGLGLEDVDSEAMFSFAFFEFPDIVVTTATDENDGTIDPAQGTGTSLREAVIAANQFAGPQTIHFASNLNGTPLLLTIQGFDESSEIGDLDVLNDITIMGNGVGDTIIDGGADIDDLVNTPGLGERIFEVHSGSLTIHHSTITGGNSMNSGGAIRDLAGGSLSIYDSEVTRNYTGINGGGIRSYATTRIENTIVSENISFRDGGGIFSSGPSLTVINSTIAGNQAKIDGGGLEVTIGTGTIINSTISGNVAISHAGGISAGFNSTVVIRNSTITGNRSDGNDSGFGSGGGIRNNNTVTILNNSILAGNFKGTGNTQNDVFDMNLSTTSSNNIIGDAATAGGLTDGVNVNQVGVSIHEVLDTTLRDNGGPTLTHALLPNSPAINRGNNALALDENMNPLTTDQRGTGFPRIVTRVDIGAFEGFLDPLTSIVGFFNSNWWLAAPQADESYNTSVAASGPASNFQKVLTGDFNGDGHDDLAAWLFNGEWRVGLSDGNGNFTFSTWTTWTVPGIKEVHVGDFNDDGLDDIIGLFPIPGGNRGRWWVGQSDGTKFLSRNWGDFGNFTGVLDVAVGNFDGVKGDDLTIITATGNLFMVKTSNTQFQYLFSHNWVVNNGFDFFQAGDFNGDGRDDVVAVFGSGANKSIFVAKSTGPATGFASLKFSDLTATQSLDSFLVGDFNGDGKDDVAARLNTTKWWLGLAGINVFNFTFGTTWSFATGGVDDIHVGSTNGDANSDILGRNNNGDWVSAESNGSSLTNRVIETWAAVNWQFVNGGDFTPQPAPAVVIPPTPSKQEADEEINPQLVSRWGGPETTLVPAEASIDNTATQLKIASDDQPMDQSFDRFGDASLLELLFSL